MKTDIYSALNDSFTTPVRDALWGHVYLTPALAALTRSAPFMRLSRILQLGPTYSVYPGATHTRAAHSIGVYHLARRLLHSLAERGADVWISATGVSSFLCAALLHDTGHFPYTHSLKELPLCSHEALTGALILSEPLKTLVSDTGADPYLTAAIVDTDLPGSDGERIFYRKLLSGALDPDKLDYLNRDARYCGVPYGAQDVDFIFSRLYPHQERGVDIDSRLIPSVEAVLFSKYLMYKAVYWHRSVRAATAMIKNALITGLESGIIVPEDLYNLDDQGLFVLLAQHVDHFGTVGEAVRNGRYYTPVAEFPYTEVDSQRLSEELCSVQSRCSFFPLPGQAVLIDIPELLSLETKLFVLDEKCFFENSSTVFTPETVQSFQKSLRTVRVFADPAYEDTVKNALAAVGRGT
jgi:HD superfamily phosphohydrolase